MKRQRTWLRPTALLLTLLLAAAACGGSSDDAGDTTTTTAGSDGGGQPAGEPGVTAGFDGTTITLGILTPTSGPAAVIGNPLTKGNQVFFDQLNAAGGIAGKYPVELEVRDTAYTEATAIQEYTATKDNVVMYTQILGTAILKAVLPKLKQDKIVAAPATLDAEWVHEQYLLPIGGPYQIQTINGVDWYVNEGGGEGKKICSLAQDDPYGDAGQQGLDYIADDLGIELGPRVDFATGNPDYTTQISQLESAGCEAVVLVATPLDASNALKKASQVGFAPTWLGQSPSFLRLLFEGDLTDYATANVKILSEGPVWGDTSKPGMADMVAGLEQYGGDQVPDPYFGFGYNQARAVAQVLEAAVADGDLSRDGIVKAMNSIDELDFQGLLGNYAWGPPEDRSPARTSTIFKVDFSAPTGLAPEAENYESEAAKSFEFPTG